MGRKNGDFSTGTLFPEKDPSQTPGKDSFDIKIFLNFSKGAFCAKTTKLYFGVRAKKRTHLKVCEVSQLEKWLNFMVDILKCQGE